MKKILIIFDTPYPQIIGGGQRRLYEISKKITGYSFSWFSFNAGGAERNHINYIFGSKMPQMYSFNGSRNAKEPFFYTITCLANIKIFLKYDIWWIGQWPLVHLPLLILIGKIFRKKIVIDWWEVWSYSNWVRYSNFFGPIGFFIQSLTLWLIRVFAIDVVTDNSKDYKQLEKILGKNFSIYEVSNGIDDRWIANQFLCPAEQCIYDVVILGRLKNHKGVDLLLDAVSLCASRGVYLKVAIIGDGPERDNLLKQSKKNGTLEHVNFFGEIPFDQVKTILLSAKIFALTTHNGGGGNLSILDAYGAGLPVICFRSNDGVDLSLVDNSLTGVIIERVDSYLLAECLECLYLDYSRLNEMRVNVRNKKNNLTWSVLAKQYKKIFDSLC